MRSLRGSSRLGRVVLAVVMLVLGASIGMGAMVGAQSSGRVYYGCLASNGTIYAVNLSGPAGCKKGDLQIEWNEQGPQGIPGENGLDGADGADGAPGADGADGLPGADGADGINCWDLDGNGQGDVATEDANGDGVVDVLDCKGEKGDQGEPGPAAFTSIVERSTDATVAAHSAREVVATCDVGQTLVSGGYGGGLMPTGARVLVEHRVGNGWRVYVENQTGSSFTFRTYAYCAAS